MGTFRLTDDVTALAQDITSEHQVATFTNTTGRTLNVLPAISLSGIQENGQTITTRVYINDGTNDLGCFRYTTVTAGNSETELGLNSFTPATSSSASRDAIPLRDGLTMRITLASADAGDTSVGVITRFLDGDAQAVSVETIGPKTNQNIATGTTEYQSESADDRLVVVSAYLNGLSNGAANLDIRITPVDNAETYEFAAERTYRTIKDPTTATRAVLDRCGISSNQRLTPIFVRGDQKLFILILSSNAGDTTAGYTVYIESLETPRSGSGAPFIFIDDDQ